MNNVLLYVRVSTDEQADKGYSLRDQEQKLLSYCQMNNLNVLGIYKEDYSAKSFKRPEFKKLLDFCKKNKRNINQLLFIKWDRFSRNTAESYMMISNFNALAIKVNAIEQPLDMTIPEQGLMLAVYLSIPEVENHRRSLNVISGMRRALKEGRYTGSAPKGYSKVKDQSKKPILVPNADAALIQETFELMSTGVFTQKQVMVKMNAKGLKTSKTPFSMLLRNPIYYGAIFIKAYNDEVETTIQGIHEPIITKRLFDDVQDVLNKKRKDFHINRKKQNPKFPLRGFLRCPKCNNSLTASTSKGRTKHYDYYHCISPCKGRYKIEDADLWISSFFKAIDFNNAIKPLFQDIVKEKLNNKFESKKLGPKHYENVKNIKLKIEKLHDMYIDGEIEKKDYVSTKFRYQNILEELRNKETNSIDQKDILKLYNNAINKLDGLSLSYTNATIEEKRLLIGSIFQNQIYFENKKVRTTDLNPFIVKIASINSAYQGIKKWDKSKKIELSHEVERMGFEPTMQLPTYKLSRLAL
jgi:site-specific DNA recombinase